jgi:hypothetical protein
MLYCTVLYTEVQVQVQVPDTVKSVGQIQFQIVLSRSFVGGAFAYISALKVTAAQGFYFRAVVVVTSSAEMKVKTPPTKLLGKTIWNPRPEIDLARWAVSDESNSFRLFLGHQN